VQGSFDRAKIRFAAGRFFGRRFGYFVKKAYFYLLIREDFYADQVLVQPVLSPDRSAFAISSRAAGPGVINLLPSDYRAANKNWAVAEDDAGTLYAGNDKGLLEFDGLQWRLYELPRASIVRSVAPLSHDVIFTGGFEEFGRWGSRRFGVRCAIRRSFRLSAIPAFRTAISGKSTSRRRGCCFNRSTASTFMITSASAA